MQGSLSLSSKRFLTFLDPTPLCFDLILFCKLVPKIWSLISSWYHVSQWRPMWLPVSMVPPAAAWGEISHTDELSWRRHRGAWWAFSKAVIPALSLSLEVALPLWLFHVRVCWVPTEPPGIRKGDSTPGDRAYDSESSFAEGVRHHRLDFLWMYSWSSWSLVGQALRIMWQLQSLRMPHAEYQTAPHSPWETGEGSN